MKNNLLILVDSLEKYEQLKRIDASFLFPLKNFSLNDKTFELDDIPSCKAYLLVNRLLDCQKIDEFEELIKNIPNFIKGIVFEDIGVLELLKDSNLELIWFQNHYGTNTEIVNYWFSKGVSATVLSYDITKMELENICRQAKGEVVVKIFGYNQIMYSRRNLLSNFQENFKLERKSSYNLKEVVDGLEFIALEDNFGTIILNKKIFDGRCLLGLDNVKYFLVDTSYIDIEIVNEFLNGLDDKNKDLGDKFDNGFLFIETIYKLKEEGVK